MFRMLLWELQSISMSSVIGFLLFVSEGQLYLCFCRVALTVQRLLHQHLRVLSMFYLTMHAEIHSHSTYCPSYVLEPRTHISFS